MRIPLQNTCVKTKGVSVIICSQNQKTCQQAIESIKNTIGIEFEIIVFDNNDKQWGICKVYNHCALQANYSHLCFVHEDVVLPTPNWGKSIVEFIEKTPNCGVVGFAGGTIATKNFMGWWSGTQGRFRYSDTVFYKPDKDYDISDLRFRYHNPENVDFAKVITLDGLFLFTNYDVWKENPFDEEAIKGFHFYDADFTFGIAQKRQNYVCMTADIYHFSGPNFDKSFYVNAQIFQKKWKNKLPCTIGEEKILFLYEHNNAINLYHNSIKHGLEQEECKNHLIEINHDYEMSVKITK